jgi:sugar phosphate isomerase/epimerase
VKLGIFTVLFNNMTFEQMLDHVAEAGLDTVEIGTGGHPGGRYCDVKALLASDEKRQAYLDAITSRGLEISALSCHANPLHPNKTVAAEAHEVFEDSVKLASLLGVKNVVTFSGCPGESENSQHPVWVVSSWPPEHTEVLDWQWNEKVIPYWREQNAFLEAHGVRVAIEPHPNFVVYNNETMMKLRSACGDNIGINFDPSHLFWQGIDPVASIHALIDSGALFHVHAKDTGFNAQNKAVNGVLDTKPYSDERRRSWIFRTVGFGHGSEFWTDLISALQIAGYQGAISIEHEDSLMEVEEGFQKAVSFLQPLIIREKLAEIWWA